MPTLTLSLFGSFELRANSRVVMLPTRKCEALLALLSLSPKCVASREQAAALLWPDVPRTQARHSLRQTIHAVRRTLTTAGIGTLATTRDLVEFVAPDLEIDVVKFDELIQLGSPDALDRALDLFRGDLLRGVVTRERPFDEWIDAHRVRFGQMARDIGLRRAETLRAEGRSDRALQIARKLLAIDPHHQPVRQMAMELARERAADRADKPR
jgi:DNA-binding SARP family transcriptional activator